VDPYTKKKKGKGPKENAILPLGSCRSKTRSPGSGADGKGEGGVDRNGERKVDDIEEEEYDLRESLSENISIRAHTQREAKAALLGKRGDRPREKWLAVRWGRTYRVVGKGEGGRQGRDSGLYRGSLFRSDQVTMEAGVTKDGGQNAQH